MNKADTRAQLSEAALDDQTRGPARIHEQKLEPANSGSGTESHQPAN